jgi:23S rRNA (cytidine1920-2'-O)/16S rRNA (cytidine1409-2'-O)-methyltransferase
MVKPQFEVGRDGVGKGGVVRDPGLRARAVLDVAEAAYELGLGVAGVTVSPLPGPSGNIEYFLWLRRGAPPVDPAVVERLAHEDVRAVRARSGAVPSLDPADRGEAGP